MSTLIAIITWDINYRLERNYAISFNRLQKMVFFWGVCNFPVRLGRWLPGTAGLVGAISSARATCKKSLITAAFCYFPGFRLKTLPVRFLPWLSAQFRKIGTAVSVIVRFLWKRWWIKSDSRALVTKLPTGCTWAQPPAGGGWIGKISGRGWRSKKFMFIRCLSAFDKSCRLAKG